MSDTIDRQAAIDALVEILDRPNHAEFLYGDEICGVLGSLPSVQPEQKKGKWINVNDGKWNTFEVLKCSVCGELDNRMDWTDNFCPNCGADMRGE